MRTCDAIGIQEIFVLNNRIPRHKKWGPKSSSSAAKWLTVHQFTGITECFDSLRKKYSTIVATHLGTESVDLYDLDFTGKIALVFGNEHSGVSEDILPLTDGNFIIPQVGMIQSLNISVACAVTLYEAFRQKKMAGHYNQRKLNEPEFRGLWNEWSLKNRE